MAKNNQSLAHRAASIKPEYSPLEAPPNPNEEEARAAIREYAAQMGLLANPPARTQRPPLTAQPDAVLVGECMIWDEAAQAVVTINQPDAVTHVYHCAGYASRDALGGK